jgi:hypothetical protein
VIGIKKGVSMNSIRTAWGIACAATFIVIMSNQALADEDDSRKACESLAALSTQVFRVDASQWVAASRHPAGPGGATAEVPAHCLFRVVMDPRDSQGPQSWARLFLVPGMTHCGGGQSTDQFDMLTAIQQWVEQGQAPDRVVASGRAFPGKTRPLCPYPKVARFDGGNPDKQESFSCR